MPFTYNPVAHSAVELVSTVMCFWIARHAYLRYKRVPNAFHLLWVVAFTYAGAVDVVHATVSYIDPTKIAVWVPFTWFVGRFVLLVFLNLAAWWANVAAPKVVWRRILLVTLAVTTVFLLPGFGMDQAWVYNSADSPISRPGDLFLVGLSALLLIAVVRRPAASMMAPSWFLAFLTVGMICHISMAFFSRESLDAAFMTAHLLKVLEYGIWIVSMALEDKRAAAIGYPQMFAEKIAKRHKDLDDVMVLLEGLRSRG